MGKKSTQREPVTGDVGRLRLGRVELIGLLATALALSACGNTLYAIQANAASSKLEEAKELGAEKYAPYEYYYAREHLAKASEEAAEADYGDATDLAAASEEHADKAIQLTREAHREAGR
ncbi:MAG: DUF4398 domain-containing protein [Polyangiaceae bacterium]|nr:DUF4398 domain-containing protein [Polyangiaceae bacterium]